MTSMIVLLNILAAALQDYNRAIILGSNQTYGKGTVQNIIDLNNVIQEVHMVKQIL